MTIEAKILSTLERTERLCDDCLSEVTGVNPRQAINSKCRELVLNKTVARATEDCVRCRRVKIVNRLIKRLGSKGAAPPVMHASTLVTGTERPWYWEGNVQSRIVDFLIAHGCAVQSAADTASRQQGKDIIATRQDNRTLWVTVKGFPEKSKNTQARHWFAGALHDLARYRDEDARAVLAMGLPHGFTTYESLIRRNAAVRKFLGYSVYWVSADGAVTVDHVA